jgi:hypothetical protein
VFIGSCYAVGTQYQPHEHELRMTLKHLQLLADGLQQQDPQNPVLAYYDDFVIYPIHPAPLTPGGRLGGHGMIVFNPCNYIQHSICFRFTDNDANLSVNEYSCTNVLQW